MMHTKTTTGTPIEAMTVDGEPGRVKPGGVKPDRAKPGGATPDEARAEHETLMALGFPAVAQHRAQAKAQPMAQPAPPSVPARRLLRRERRRSTLREFAAEQSGAVTAEYTLVIVAGVAFAGVLIALMRSEEIRAMLATLIQNALGSAI